MRFLPISLLVLALYAQSTVAAESIRILLQNSPLAGSQYYAVSTSRTDIRVGDRLTLIGGDGCSPDEVAVRAGTIGYEVLTSLGARYSREYLRG